MFKRLSTDAINWVFIIGIILFIVEIIFFHGSLIVTSVFLGFLVFIGWKNYFATWGKVIFWIGLCGIAITFLNMIAVKFIIVVFIIFYLIDYAKTKNTTYIKPHISDDPIIYPEEPLIKMNNGFKQILYGDERTDETAYEWHDINIQGGIGDRIIDLSNTVLPEDTAVISIRHGIGNITIYLPYETEFMMHHSAIFGRAYILHKKHLHLLNQHFSYKTEGYDTKGPRVKIITSLVSGNIEVKRI